MDEFENSIAAINNSREPVANTLIIAELSALDDTLLALGAATADLMDVKEPDDRTRALLLNFGRRYLKAIQAAKVALVTVIQKNLNKTRGRFLESALSILPTFDGEF